MSTRPDGYILVKRRVKNARRADIASSSSFIAGDQVFVIFCVYFISQQQATGRHDTHLVYQQRRPAFSAAFLVLKLWITAAFSPRNAAAGGCRLPCTAYLGGRRSMCVCCVRIPLVSIYLSANVCIFAFECARASERAKRAQNGQQL